MLKSLLIAAAVTVMPILTAAAGTIVLTVGPRQQFSTIAAAVSAANGDDNSANYYVIAIAPGTYTNDTATVNRPMTIEAAQPGSAVILNETVTLTNLKGILISYAPLTVDGLTFQNASIPANQGANGAGIRAGG